MSASCSESSVADVHNFTSPALDWVCTVNKAHGWDLGFAYIVGLLLWLHLLLPIGALTTATIVGYAAPWVYQHRKYLRLKVAYWAVLLRLHRIERKLIRSKVRGRYLGLVTGLLQPRALTEGWRIVAPYLGTSSRLGYLLCLVSWQEVVGLLGLLGWAVAALTPNMWTCFPGGDTLAWLRMQLSLALARGHWGWTFVQLAAAVNLVGGLWRLSGGYMDRRRALLRKQDERRRAHQAAAMAKEQQHGTAAQDGSASRDSMSSNAAPHDPSTLPPLRALPGETLSERLGLPPLDTWEWCALLGFGAPLSIGAVWAADPTGPLAVSLCGSFTWYWSLSVYKTAPCLWLPLLLAVCVGATVWTPKARQRWTAALMANKVRLLATKDGVAARSAKALEAEARRLTENDCGPEPTPLFQIIIVLGHGIVWLLAVLWASVLVVWALRPGYLPAQVVGAWPWQGPQLWVGSVGGGSSPMCYAPGSYPVVHHTEGLPSAAGLWQAVVAANEKLHGGSGAEDLVSEPVASYHEQEQQPARRLVAGERHTPARLGWDTVRKVLSMDWGGCLARAARVNLLAARAWRQHGLQGVRGAMAALRALQTAGGNETAAAAALEELRRVQQPGWNAAAHMVEVAGGTTGKGGPDAAAAGGGGGGSGRRGKRAGGVGQAGSGRRGKRRKVQRREDQGEGVGSSADGDAAAAAAAATDGMRTRDEHHAEEDVNTQEQSTTRATTARPPELQQDAASSRQQHLLALGLALVVTPLLLTAQVRWDIIGLLRHPDRLAEAVMLGMAWVLEMLLRLIGQNSSGGGGGRRTHGAKRMPWPWHVWAKQPQAKQQEHQRKPAVGGGKETSPGEQSRQGAVLQAALPAAVQVTAKAPVRQQHPHQQQPSGRDDARDTQKRAMPSASPRPKAGPVRQPTAMPVPTKKTPHDRQRGSHTRDSANSDQGAAGTCDDTSPDWHQVQKQQQRRRQDQVAAAAPRPTGRTVSAAEAVAALTSSTAGLSSKHAVQQIPNKAAAVPVGTAAPPRDQGPSIAVRPRSPPAGTLSVPTPAAAPTQAPPQPSLATPRRAPVPINPRAVRPATLVDILGSRTLASPQQPATIAPASATSPGSAPAPRPVIPIPIPIPVITSTAPGPAVPAAPARLSPGGPSSTPRASPAGSSSVPPFAPFLNPALANYLMGSTPTVTTEIVAGETAPAAAEREG